MYGIRSLEERGGESVRAWVVRSKDVGFIAFRS